MSEDPDISVRHVCKTYRIWDRPSARTLSPLQASIGEEERARSYPDFWAISNRRLANLASRWASGSCHSRI
jgi:hypothetical protein